MVSLIKSRWDAHFGGILLVCVIAAAATFLSEHYGAPAMLFALLIGMAFHFLYDDQKFTPGLEFSAKTLLRFGVGLLGLRLSIGDLESVGLGAVGAVVGFVMATLACGAILSILFGRKLAFGLLAGGSVAICGASAALAIASVLPAKDDREQDTLFVVIGVTALSTIAMIAYPVLFAALGMSDLESGFLIGATIHDVAQVVGAGYSISDEAGVIATFVKMVRVALLPVVMIAVMTSFRGAQAQKITLPWFLVMFVALAILTNTGLVPQVITDAIATLSGWCLVIAISALGVKTSLATILRVKPSYGIILVVETLFLLGISVAFVMGFGF
ncbi:YeiH family protein [Phaeobacter gallaeciensis]|uniref:YeiH family protein n=1 Tax=Phaeobacter gallaeciensis TaxID=60890 RepID=UPI000BBCB1A3|nr:putative sulfate exporter family transporter [Phaeobacter gallaeciensis]ATF19263.1 putative membrane protein [Phaeobacter gallaeciensis]ATF23372.1 putative membrane protein [Phaeobacter gallaeciensis]